ncbi:Protein of unknown function [Lutibacter agarilyticus]|uniref:Uncharacterized protein n=1 Tax=Lutibacter agarilyticus TaxID=1109740 RepID=A0A238VCU3_9FLAO|nr:Protein of unknown function [Lutibacter agarilyticus]
MVSFINMSELDTIYILKADYFDTHGASVRKYLKEPFF